MASSVTISVLNRTGLSNLNIYIFSEQFRMEPLNPEMAWRIINVLELDVRYELTFSSGSEVRAASESGNMVSPFMIVTSEQRGFQVVQTAVSLVLEPAANPPSASAVSVTNNADLENGVTAYLLKNEKIYLRSNSLEKGQTVTFEPNAKLYWSVSHDNGPLSPVTELDVEGLRSLDWTLSLEGHTYKFTASNVVSASK